MIAQRPQLQFSLVDASDSIGNTSVWLPNGVTVATAVAAADTFRTAVAPCTDAVFVRQAVIYGFVEAPKPDPGDESDVTRVGVFIFLTASDEYAVITINGIVPGVLLTTGPGAGLLIDVTHTGVAALVDELISGDWCNPFGEQLVSLEAAYVQIRR